MQPVNAVHRNAHLMNTRLFLQTLESNSSFLKSIEDNWDLEAPWNPYKIIQDIQPLMKWPFLAVIKDWANTRPEVLSVKNKSFPMLFWDMPFNKLR